MRKLEQDDVVTIHLAQERHLILGQQRYDLGREPHFGRHADMQWDACFTQRRFVSPKHPLNTAARVLITARVHVRRHDGIDDTVVRRCPRQGERIGQRFCTVIDAR